MFLHRQIEIPDDKTLAVPRNHSTWQSFLGSFVSERASLHSLGARLGERCAQGARAPRAEERPASRVRPCKCNHEQLRRHCNACAYVEIAETERAGEFT